MLLNQWVTEQIVHFSRIGASKPNLEIQKEYELIKMTCEQIKKDNDLLIKKYEQQFSILEDKQTLAMELDIKLKLNLDKIITLETELSSANNKINTLRHEQQFTLQEKANLEGQLKQMQRVISEKRAISMPA